VLEGLFRTDPEAKVGSQGEPCRFGGHFIHSSTHLSFHSFSWGAALRTNMHPGSDPVVQPAQ
jgi:hypothetical protein